MVLYEQPEDPAAFRDYYLTKHLPKARLLPGLKALRYTTDVCGVGGDSPFIAIFQADFGTVEEMAAALESPAGHDAQHDVANFATGAVHIVHFGSDG